MQVCPHKSMVHAYLFMNTHSPDEILKPYFLVPLYIERNTLNLHKKRSKKKVIEKRKQFTRGKKKSHQAHKISFAPYNPHILCITSTFKRLALK